MSVRQRPQSAYHKTNTQSTLPPRKKVRSKKAKPEQSTQCLATGQPAARYGDESLAALASHYRRCLLPPLNEAEVRVCVRGLVGEDVCARVCV